LFIDAPHYRLERYVTKSIEISMALEFELNLILPHQNSAIFCRSTIEATRYLIKQKCPHLAMHLTNTLRTEPLPINEAHIENDYQQSFYVDMNPEQVSEIVELLLHISQDEQNEPTPGLMNVAKSLYQDWLDYANSLDMVNK
jgi:hypothetical protein